MATVYQEDYNNFYESIIIRVKYGDVSWGCAAAPRRMSMMERAAYKIQRKIKLMSQPHDEAISLSGKEYGDFIDMFYKASFIKFKRVGDNNEIEKLEEKIVRDLIRKKEFNKMIEYPSQSSSTIKDPSDATLERIQKIISEMAYKEYISSFPKKKSFWDKMKDFFNE